MHFVKFLSLILEQAFQEGRAGDAGVTGASALASDLMGLFGALVLGPGADTCYNVTGFP